MEEFDSQFGKVELTSERKRHIFEFHPEAKEYQKYLKEALARPDTIRRSKFDPAVLILYRSVAKQKYLAVVIKTNKRNFILTLYLTHKIKHHPL